MPLALRRKARQCTSTLYGYLKSKNTQEMYASHSAESPLDPRACRRVKLLISNYRHTARTSAAQGMKLWRMFTSIGLEKLIRKSLKRSPCVLRLPPAPVAVSPPFTPASVASPINRALRFSSIPAFTRSGVHLYAAETCVYTSTQMCICTHRCIRTCTARVYAPTWA